jgi:hypothetical protein
MFLSYPQSGCPYNYFSQPVAHFSRLEKGQAQKVREGQFMVMAGEVIMLGRLKFHAPSKNSQLKGVFGLLGSPRSLMNSLRSRISATLNALESLFVHQCYTLSISVYSG